MKRCKKMLSMVLCILMVLGMFAACNRQAPVETIGPTEPVETEDHGFMDPIVVTEPATEPAETLSDAATVEYTIVYAVNGGQLPETALTVYSLANPAVLPVPTKEGCIFLGWFEAEDFSGDVVLTTAGQTGNKTYYAKWDESKAADPDDESADTTEPNATVTANVLNIRESASASSAQVGTYGKGDRIAVLEKKGDWGRTKLGWVSLKYVRMDKTFSESTGSSNSSGNSQGNITHVHEYKLVKSVEETCYDDGYHAYKCKCGESYKEYIARSHKWGEWVVVREATDLEEGLKKRTCTECGVVDRAKLTKLPHTHFYESTVIDPTCTEDGYTLYECNCGDVYTGAEFKATGHDYKEEVVAPTTEAEGYTLHTCKNCGDSYKDTYTEKLPPEETEHVHSYTSVVTAPTCTEDGYTTNTCECGESYVCDAVAATGHDYESQVVPPTASARGYTLHTCKNCGDSYKDNYVDKLPETEPEDPYDPPEIEGHTHTWGEWLDHEDGWQYRICPECGEMDIAW